MYGAVSITAQQLAPLGPEVVSTTIQVAARLRAEYLTQQRARPPTLPARLPPSFTDKLVLGVMAQIKGR